MKQQTLHTAMVETLSHDGRGIARINGKTTFLLGGLPTEEVSFVYNKKHSNYDEGQVVEVNNPAAERVIPSCQHFGICGGCSLQHMHNDQQISLKQNVLLEQLRHFGDLSPQTLLPPITAPIWGYRHKARLSVKYVVKKAALLVGFHEKNGRYVADLQSCEVLHPRVGKLITPLKELINSLSIAKEIAQIEVAIGDEVVALILRNLQPPSPSDEVQLSNFATQHDIALYLQPGGMNSVYLLSQQTKPLSYHLADYGIEIVFQPNDFSQVNPEINRKLVKAALELLDLKSTDKALDLFCGLGNFTLPIAKFVAHVTGIEGETNLVERAKQNAIHNNITNTDFFRADLMREDALTSLFQQQFDKVLLDPPRLGALAVVKQLAKTGAKRIVYVSCNPATLARDAAELVHNQGYRLTHAGILDMFPHTSHVESIAVFVK